MWGCTSLLVLISLVFTFVKLRQSNFYFLSLVHSYKPIHHLFPPSLQLFIFRNLFAALVFSFCSITLFAQQKITGIVTNSASHPMQGVTVGIKNYFTGTTTDTAGRFTIMAKANDFLVISFVGYRTAELKVGNQNNLSITLSESLLNLDEVVVTGYTTQRIKEITGSVAIVKPKDLTAIPAGQVEQMLQGRVAGLNVITSGLPGGGSNVRLHGIGNFGDVTPLYVIDGVQGDINNLNPNDIESLQVLKDAGAYSIYGVRGANGVIIITTRNGKPGKTKISYDLYMGTTRPLNNGLNLLNAQEIADLTWVALKNSNRPLAHSLYGSGQTPVLPDYFIADENIGLSASDPLVNPDLYNIDFATGPINQIIKANKEGTDWFHEFFNPAFSQNHSLAVSGSNERNKYYLSLGYLNQQGTMINSFLKRYTVKINTQFAPFTKFRIGENFQVMNRESPGYVAESAGPDDNEIAQAITTNPLLPVYDIKGGWAHFIPLNFFDNPVSTRVIAKDDRAQLWELFGNVYAEVDLLKNFTLRTSFGGRLNFRYSYDFLYYSYYPQNNLPNNSLTEISGYDRSWTWTNTLKFSKAINEHHHINALAGIESIDNYNRFVTARKTGLALNEVNYRFLINGSQSGQSNSSIAKASSLHSLFSKVDYAIKDKYFFSVTVRNDGSSVFNPDRRYGWFPSVSAAWRMTEESLMENILWITDFKLRASWGKTGFYGNTDPYNQYTLYGGNVADAAYDLAGTSNSPLQGFRRVQLGDPKTGWQEDVVTNVGFESVFWNGKLYINADWYLKKAKGLLFQISLPGVLGGATPPNINVGAVNNTGIDLLIGSKGKLSKDLSWDAALTFTTYKNRIKLLTDLPFFIPSIQFPAGPLYNQYVRNQVGQPTNSFFGYRVIGIFQNDDEVNRAPQQPDAAPGRFRYLNANNDDKINADDRIFLGHANPDFTAGLNISIRYKNFDISTFFYGSFGNEVVNVPKLWIDFFQSGAPFKIFPAKSKDALYNSWTPARQNATVPIIETERNFSNVDVFNSYILEDGSYFRNKSLVVGYALPKHLLEKIKSESIRIYLQAMNLFTITKYSGLDPELSGLSSAFGIDYGNFPNNQKQYYFGISVNF